MIDLEETAENQLISEDAFRYQQQTTSIQTTQETLFETTFSMAGRPSRESKSFSENSGKESGTAGMTEAEKTSLASPRISNQSRSNSDIYQDVYQTNTLSESYEDRYRKSTTEVYDSYKTGKTEQTIYDRFEASDLLEQGFATITITEGSKDDARYP